VPPLKRPPSTGTATGSQFHKGLVNALQDVLRKQRQGVFPGPDGMDAPPVRPSTQGGASYTTTLHGATPSNSDRVEELIRRKKTEWAQRRWQQNQQNEKKEIERDITSANAFARRHRLGSASSSNGTYAGTGVNSRLFDGGFDDDDDGFVWRVLQTLERQEQRERDQLSQQWMKHISDMMTNFTTFIKTKILLSPTSSANVSSSSVNRPPSAASPLSGLHGRRVSGVQYDESSGDLPNSPVAASSHMRSRPGTAPRQSAILSEAQSAVAIEEFRQQGNRYYEQNDFCSAYLVYSKALELASSASLPENAGGHRNTTIPVLLANRAATNMMLLNYDACAKDCLSALHLDVANVKVQQRLAKAYTLAGQHRSSQAHYAATIKLLDEQGRGPSDALRGVVQDEWSSSTTLEKMRRALETEHYSECVALSTSLKAFQGEPAVVFARCAALVMVEPAAARQELSKYFNTLECPTDIVSNAASSPLIGAGDVITITGAYSSHYCDILLLLAKASFYCGQHYMTIATSYAKQCLALRPEHRHAQSLAKTLSALETKMDDANQHFLSGRFGDAHASLSAALALDTNNKKIRGALFNSRAESSVKIGNVAAAISDCTSALECDPTLVKALTRRAKCFADIGDFSRAVRDMERAAELNPSLADDVRAFRSQQRDDNTAYSTFQRRFGSAGPSGRPQTGSQRGGEDNGSSSSSSRPGTGAFAQPQVVCPYSALLLPRLSTIEQVKTQYKKLILQYHPDKLVNQPQAVRDASAVKFRSISEAYGMLSDVSLKQQYDANFR
jgi:tetratricopeptide (TPR) repeat protein